MSEKYILIDEINFYLFMEAINEAEKKGYYVKGDIVPVLQQSHEYADNSHGGKRTDYTHILVQLMEKR